MRECRDTHTHFICHKSNPEIVHCRGVHDLYRSRAHQFATRLGIPIVEKDMDQP